MSPTPRRVRGALVAAVLAAIALVPATSSAAPAAAPVAGTVFPDRVCADPAPGHAACLAMLDRDADGKPLSRAEAAAAGVSSYMAGDLQKAYNLPSSLLGARQTIAIVDAFDDPKAEADLAEYRKENGLPPCDADFPCFRKVNQRGEDTPPPANVEWAAEISLDLDTASAACPNCRLLLVEADDNSIDNLGAAVDQAAAMGAEVISNSYGSVEYNTELGELGDHFNHPGTTIVAASGDSGFGVQVPAALSTVVAVGGTTLFHDSSTRGWGETAWAGTGSGCSAYVAKPSWQGDRLCDKRTVTDVSAVADVNTPVNVYDTFGHSGWIMEGGTSAATPLVAGVFALAGNATTIDAPAYLTAHRNALNDVTAGSNGTCGGGYLCTAVRGYDGPTGNGTPNGIGAF